MFASLKSLFGRKRPSTRLSPRPRFTPELETLEQREVKDISLVRNGSGAVTQVLITGRDNVDCFATVGAPRISQADNTLVVDVKFGHVVKLPTFVNGVFMTLSVPVQDQQIAVPYLPLLGSTADPGAIVFQGSSGNDSFTCSPAVELRVSVDGGAGNDTLEASRATVRGGTGNDTLRGDGSTLEGGAGNDTYQANGSTVVFRGTDLGNDVVSGSNNNLDFSAAGAGVKLDLALTGTQNVLPSSPGSSGLRLTLGSATAVRNVSGSAFDDSVSGNALDNILEGNGGRDFIEGREGNDTLTGGEGDDTLKGQAGNDTLYGQGGADVLDGGEGNDFLNGGFEDQPVDGQADTLVGGAGSDTFGSNEHRVEFVQTGTLLGRPVGYYQDTRVDNVVDFHFGDFDYLTPPQY